MSWQHPKTQRSQGVWRAPLANSKRSPAPNQQPPPPPQPSDDASSNEALSVHCCSKRRYCRRSGAFDQHMRARAPTHTHTQRCACKRTHKDTGLRICKRKTMHHGCHRPGDAYERSHLCSKSPGITNLFLAKRRAHLNRFDPSVHRRRACTERRHTGLRPPSAPLLCAPSSL